MSLDGTSEQKSNQSILWAANLCHFIKLSSSDMWVIQPASEKRPVGKIGNFCTRYRTIFKESFSRRNEDAIGFKNVKKNLLHKFSPRTLHNCEMFKHLSVATAVSSVSRVERPKVTGIGSFFLPS